MKTKNLIQMLGVLVAATISTGSVVAAGTDTWIGNTDANWNTAANWTTVGGSTPPASDDSLVFGAAGSAGAALNNDIAGLVVNRLTFNSGADSFTFSGNGFTNDTGGIDASALTGGTETINNLITLAPGVRRWNVGAGATLALGNIGVLGGDAADTYTGAGAIAILSKTGTISTLNADGWGWRSGAIAGTGLLGPGIVIDNGDNTYDWASAGNSGGPIVAVTYTTAANSDAHNVKVTSNTTVTPNASWASILVSNATLTVNGTQLYIDTGIILEHGGTVAGSRPIKANADGLYIYTPDSGAISTSIQNNGSNAKRLYKAGPGTLSLSGGNSYSGGTVLYEGTLSVSNATALGSGALTLSGGNLDCSFTNLTLNNNAQNWNKDFAFVGSQNLNLGTGAVTLGGTRQVTVAANALTVGGAIGDATNGYGLTKAGSGTLIFGGANTYTGTTTISNGTLAIISGGSLASSNINMAAGAKLDVSAISYTLGSQTLGGSGVVTGAVATAGTASFIAPGGVGTIGTLTFQNDLNLGGGASPVFDLSTSYSSGNDQVMVAGNLTMNGNDVVHVNALSGSSPLDQTGDYVLFSVSGALSLTGTPQLQFDNTVPANANHYTLMASGNNVVLHYSLNPPPIVNSVTVTNTVNGQANAVRGQQVTVYAVVSPSAGTITNVSADLSSIGGSASQTLTPLGGNNYSYTLTVAPNAIVGIDHITVTATDTTPLSGIGSSILTVNASTETWNGMAGDDNWSSGANWISTLPPGYAGDSLVFSGSTRTSPNMDNNYSVAGLTFDGSASSFTLGSAGGNTLTLSGGVTNNSYSSQVINVPIVLNGTQSVMDPNGAGNTLAGNISGSGGLTMDTSGFGILTLSGTNTYSGDTTVPSVFGTLYLGSSAAIPNGAGKGNVNVTGTLNLNGNNAAINGLSGVGYVDNTGGSPVALSLGNGDAASTFGGLIQNNGAALTLVKVGAGVLTLSGGNTFSGGTTLSAGQITLGASSTGVPVTSGPLGTGPVTLSGGTLQMNAKTLGNDLIVSAGTTNIIDNAAGNSTLSGNLSGAGTVTLQNSGNVNMSVYGGASPDWSGFTGTFKYVTGGHVINFNPGGTVCDLSHAAFYMSGNISYSTLGIGAGQTLKLGSLSGPSGYVYVNDGAALEIGNLNADTTFGGIIQGSAAGNVTKVGSGTLTLTGANTYTGPTTVSNGTLVVSTLSGANGNYIVADGGTLGVSVAGGGSLKVASLTFGNSGSTFVGLNSSLNPAITNSGALTLAGTVMVNVSGPILPGQYLLIAFGSISGTGGFITNNLPGGVVANITTNGNTIVLNVTTGSSPLVWSGLNNTNWDATTANNWSSNSVPVIYSDGQVVQFDDSSARTNVYVATNVAPMILSVSNNNDHYTFTSAAGTAITGSSSLTKDGSGTLTLANTYTGGTVINNGTLELGDGVANNGVVAGNVADNGNLIFANPFDQTFSAVINGPGSVVKRSPGNLTFSLNNTYAGGTLLDNSTVTLPNGAVQAFGTGTLTFSNATLYVKPGGGSSYNSANSDYLGNNVVIPAGTASVIDNSANNYGNLWVGGDGVQWTGSGTVTIQNSSSVAGAAVLWNGNPLANFNGTLNIGATGSGTMYVGIGYNSGNGGTGASVATFDASGAACTLDNSGSTLCQVVDANCTTVKFGSLSASNPGTVLRGNSSSSPADQLTFEVGALNTSTTFAGKIADWGSAGTGLKKVGTGSLELSGANTYTGPTTVNGGVLKIDTAFLAASGDIVITSPGVLNLNFSGNNTVNALTLDGVQQAAGTYGATGSGAAHIDDVHFAGAGVLNVTTGPAPTPEPINAVFSGGVLQLSWSNSTWSLQMQTNSLATGLSTNWTTLIPANSGINGTNITVDPTGPVMFYRLTYP